MNPEHGWTKEMIDEIKDCKFNNCFPIIIKVQKNNYEFKDKERNEENKFAANLPISYKGIFSRSHCLEEEWGSRVPDYDSEKYKPWGRVDIFIQFYDHNTRIFKELSIEPYKYGYLTFLNSEINGKLPRLGIGLNKECGIKETIDDLFVKSRIFNHKDLDMEIYYDCEFVKNIEYENLLNDEHNINLVPIKSIILNVSFGLGQQPYIIVKE